MSAVDVERVTLRHDGVVVLADLTLHVEDGELLTVVGPSGSGKTTLLRVLAGLEPVDEGTVRIGGRDVTEVPAAQRDVAMVFQQGGLQPHLTSRDNIAFPLRVRRTGPRRRGSRRAEQDLVDERVEASARAMGLEELLDRLPRQLSAGSRQSVETTRELGRAPEVFLLDEPLANVDAHQRMRMRRELTFVQRGSQVTMIYATNDQAEAMAVGDRVAVLVDGAVMQVGTPMEVHDRPATATVGELIGSPPMNLLPVGAGEVVLPDRVAPSDDARGEVRGDVRGEVLVGARPADLDPEPRPDALRVGIEVRRVTSVGSEVHVQGRAGQETVAAVLRTPLSIAVPAIGDRLDLFVPAERLRFFDARTGVALRRRGG